MNRTRAQRRWMRKGYTHEVAYRPDRTFAILVLRDESAAYFRKHPLPGDWLRPICQPLIHKGRKP